MEIADIWKGMRLARLLLMTTPTNILAAILLAVLLVASALCGEAVSCAGCEHACCAKSGVGDFFRRLLLIVGAAVAATVVAPLAAGNLADAVAWLSPDARPTLRAVPLRI